MISEDVALCIVDLVHVKLLYLLFMNLSVVDVIVMLILFAPFRGQYMIQSGS